jgi:uncharacterized protein YbbC (DUF1343 family)
MIQFGIDILLQQEPAWKKQPIGLVTNHAATTQKGISARKALLDNGFNLIKLFSPEHGLDVQGADGAKMNDGFDRLTQLPIVSLYGNKLAPLSSDLQDIDILLFDIPDIGCRFYTYLWTLTHVIEACGKFNKKLIILDRPNPISGNLHLSEGPMLDEINCSSFIGRWNIPVRHSCTLGELALYFNQIKNIHTNIEVIQCKNWNRIQFQPDWGIQFVHTSPAIQSFQSALLYPGLCLLEATNLSEGRSTPFSFQAVAAPWIDGKILADIFNQLMIDEVKAEAIKFTPTHSKFSNERCSGIHLKIINQDTYCSVFTGLVLIRLIKNLYPDHFDWKPYPTNVNPSGKNHLDKLSGIVDSEKLFDLPFDVFLKKIQQMTITTQWQKEIKPYLLY